MKTGLCRLLESACICVCGHGDCGRFFMVVNGYNLVHLHFLWFPLGLLVSFHQLEEWPSLGVQLLLGLGTFLDTVISHLKSPKASLLHHFQFTLHTNCIFLLRELSSDRHLHFLPSLCTRDLYFFAALGEFEPAEGAQNTFCICPRNRCDASAHILQTDRSHSHSHIKVSFSS